MSFSGDVKREILNHQGHGMPEIYAELSAILMFSDIEKLSTEQGDFLKIYVENDYAAEKCFTLLKKSINIGTEILENAISVKEQDLDLAMIDWRNPKLYAEAEQKKVFLRGAYLGAGSMSDPHKSYHMEFCCDDREKAELLQSLMRSFEIESRIMVRKNHFVTYLKDGTAICDLISAIGAHVSLMNYENERILKEISNNINRQVNCEAANISKTVAAARKQVQDIELIYNSPEYADLPDALKEIAELRLEYQMAPLQELGAMLDPPVGKSGVNHRLRKLSEIAERIRMS